MADWAAACYSAIGVLAALRLRDVTGIGRMVETSMREATISFLADMMHEYIEFGVIPGRMGNNPVRPRPGLNTPKGLYKCKDGYVFFTPGASDKEWEQLLKVTGREDLIGDPRFVDTIKRYEHS